MSQTKKLDQEIMQAKLDEIMQIAKEIGKLTQPLPK